MQQKQYYVYLLANVNHSVIYTGVTSTLYRRIEQHKLGIGSKFTSRYNVKKLVYVEIFNDVYDAISREKQIKAGSRKKKIDLIKSSNPHWKDLAFEI